ncbi:hypothetical protein [Mesotoga sp.]|uniref:hypothetical protein n=1 Tax=Mesotoga sp. TaxID=2053577 RepID=UPI001BD56A2E|nr:hypothetical protein [Mesotoga sp.]
MKFAEAAVVILMIFLILLTLSEVSGVNRKMSDLLETLALPLINIRVDIENFFRSVFQLRSIDRVIRDLNRYAESFSNRFPYPLPMRVAFFSFERNNTAIMTTGRSAAQGVPVVSVFSSTIYGVVKSSHDGYVMVSPLTAPGVRISAVVQKDNRTVEGAVYSSGGKLYFSTFDPYYLESGDQVRIASTVQGYGYYKTMKIDLIGEIAGLHGSDYLVNTPNVFGDYFVYLEWQE